MQEETSQAHQAVEVHAAQTQLVELQVRRQRHLREERIHVAGANLSSIVQQLKRHAMTQWMGRSNRRSGRH
jgi:hypothetical protein